VTLPDIVSVSHVSALLSDRNGAASSSSPRLTLTGKAPAGSIVTVFIFSDPIIVGVKSDVSGMWSYTLDRGIPDGTHDVIATIADAEGHILARSAPLQFVKDAASVTTDVGQVPPITNKESIPFPVMTLAIIAMIIAGGGAVFSLFGYFGYLHPVQKSRSARVELH
jgi:hypothetical protein